MWRLDGITLFNAAIDATLDRWRQMIERANNISGDGVHHTPAGIVITSGAAGSSKRPGKIIVTGIVTPAPSDTEHGTGEGVLWLRGNGAELVESGTVDLYNPFKVQFEDGEPVVGVPDGDAYLIIGADCPLPEPEPTP